MIKLPCDGHSATTVRELTDAEFQDLYWKTHAEVIKHPLSVVSQVPQFLIEEDQRRGEEARLEHERGEPARLRTEIVRLRDQIEWLRSRVRALGGDA